MARRQAAIQKPVSKKKILLRSYLCPGDILMLTAAVRDLKAAHPDRYEIGVDTSCSALWDHNPHISRWPKEQADEVIDTEYPLIHRSNDVPYHFIHGYRMHLEEKLGIKIPAGPFKGDVHLSEEEKNWTPQVDGKYWIIVSGGKKDFTAKWWNPAHAKTVVDHFQGKIQFVQTGEKHHWHEPLNGVTNLIGQTDLRQFVRLMYHAQGVVCPVTFAMHLAAAIPTKVGHPKNKPCVVIAGSREPAQWEQYPHHRYLSNNGAMSCCLHGGCWKSRCQAVGDGDAKDNDLCTNPVQIRPDLKIPKCMQLIGGNDVISAVEAYFNGGILAYS